MGGGPNIDPIGDKIVITVDVYEFMEFSDRHFITINLHTLNYSKFL